MQRDGEGQKTRVHRIKGQGSLIKHTKYRFIPYEELADVLKNDGEAFLEDNDERPLKRQTLKYAVKKLSEMVGRKVKYDRALLKLDEDKSLEGYSLSVEE